MAMVECCDFRMVKSSCRSNDKRLSLAPRDIVARAIDHEMKIHGLNHVCLDEHIKMLKKRSIIFHIFMRNV